MGLPFNRQLDTFTIEWQPVIRRARARTAQCRDRLSEVEIDQLVQLPGQGFGVPALGRRELHVLPRRDEIITAHRQIESEDRAAGCVAAQRIGGLFGGGVGCALEAAGVWASVGRASPSNTAAIHNGLTRGASRFSGSRDPRTTLRRHMTGMTILLHGESGVVTGEQRTSTLRSSPERAASQAASPALKSLPLVKRLRQQAVFLLARRQPCDRDHDMPWALRDVERTPSSSVIGNPRPFSCLAPGPPTSPVWRLNDGQLSFRGCSEPMSCSHLNLPLPRARILP